MSGNMRVWEAVAVTDPAYTKKVNQRGGYTSISPQYQILQATKLWGPMGDRWDVETVYSNVGVGESMLVVADVTVIYPSDDPNGPAKLSGIRASEWLVDQKGRVDCDAWKKARTDAMTKALSQLGFSADVFLGLFDEPAYQGWAKSEVQRRKNNPAPQASVSKGGDASVTGTVPQPEPAGPTPMERALGGALPGTGTTSEAATAGPRPASGAPSATGAGSAPSGERPPAPNAKPAKPKAQRKCSKCREPGHTAKTCEARQQAKAPQVPQPQEVLRDINVMKDLCPEDVQKDVSRDLDAADNLEDLLSIQKGLKAYLATGPNDGGGDSQDNW